MTRYIVCIIIFVFALSSISCGSSKAPKKTDLTPSEEAALSESSSDLNSDQLSDFTESIYEEMKDLFNKSSMNLTSLQKNKKGTLIKAVIEETNAQACIPKAIKLLHDNFKRLEEIIVVLSGSPTVYSIKMETVDELSETHSGSDLLSELWNKVQISEETESDDKTTDDAETQPEGE